MGATPVIKYPYMTYGIWRMQYTRNVYGATDRKLVVFLRNQMPNYGGIPSGQLPL